MKLSIINQIGDYKLTKEAVKNLLNVTIATLDTEKDSFKYPLNLELTLTLTTDEAIKRLNRDFRGKDQQTDVLSFPIYNKGERILPATSLGDIVISMDTMARQAREFGHSQNRELCFLFVHGLLHLLGYDHELGEAEEKLHFRRQQKILEMLHITR